MLLHKINFVLIGSSKAVGGKGSMLSRSIAFLCSILKGLLFTLKWWRTHYHLCHWIDRSRCRNYKYQHNNKDKDGQTPETDETISNGNGSHGQGS